MPPKHLFLVRHAQSEHHVNGLTGGWTDTPLTQLGHRQATLLAERMKRELGSIPVSLFTSDLMRAGETCRHLARALGVEPIADERLREWNNGDEAGLSRVEARQRFPDAYGRSIWAGDSPLFPNAETGVQFSARCASFLDSLPDDGPLPIVVTHGGTLHAMVGHWLGLEPAALAGLNFIANPTSITVLLSSPFRGIERLNDASHLVGTESYVSLPEGLGLAYAGHA